MTHLTCPDGTPAGAFAFGTMQFGGRADTAASAAMFDACRAAGIRHFDTAFVYTDGNSEVQLGNLARADRDSLFIATKAGYVGGASARNLQDQFDISRRRLGMEMVDLLYLHRFDPETPLEDTLATFASLKASGAIRYVGLSNFAAWQVMKAQAIAHDMGIAINVLQPMYNLVKRQAEVELLPMCADQDIVAATYSPLGGGLLTGKYAGGSGSGRLAEDDRYAARYGQDWMRNAATGLTGIASDLGVHPATLAVAWVARHAKRPVPILSARNADQLAPSLAGMTFDMDAALYDRLAALTPAPPPATDRSEEA